MKCERCKQDTQDTLSGDNKLIRQGLIILPREESRSSEIIQFPHLHPHHDHYDYDYDYDYDDSSRGRSILAMVHLPCQTTSPHSHGHIGSSGRNSRNYFSSHGSDRPTHSQDTSLVSQTTQNGTYGILERRNTQTNNIWCINLLVSLLTQYPFRNNTIYHPIAGPNGGTSTVDDVDVARVSESSILVWQGLASIGISTL